MLGIALLFLTGLGSGLVMLYAQPKLKRIIPFLLSFSGAYLLSVTILHLVPDVFDGHRHELGIIVLAGFFLQLILDYFSGGIEHGHVHPESARIGRFPFLVLFSLCIHAFIEATPLQSSGSGLTDAFTVYLLGLLFHKVPIALVLVSLLISYQLSKSKIIVGLLVFSLMAPLGIILSDLLPEESDWYTYLLALAAGIILHLSTTILLETNEKHQVSWQKILPLIFGVALAILSIDFH